MTFKNTHLSVSRLKVYERCAAAFYFGYVDKGPTEPRGVAGTFGTVLHAALEATFRWIIESEFTGVFPTATLIDAYKEAWRKEDISGVELFQEGLVLLRAYAERHPMVDHLQVIAVEQEFNLQTDEFVINGYLDRVEKLGDDGILIVDYKSNRALFTRDELDTDLQAATYLWVARTLYPWAKKISFAFDMLRFNVRQAAADREFSQLDDVRDYLVTLGRKTETDAEWKPRLNELCNWCDHRGRCGEYKSALAGGGQEMVKIATLEGTEEIAAERERVAKLAKMAYARKESLDKILKAKIAQDGEFIAAGVKYKFINSFETAYPDAERVIQAFVSYGKMTPEAVRARLVGVSSSAVKALHEEVAKTLDRSRAFVLEATLAAIAVKTAQSPKIAAWAEKKGAKAQRTDDEAKEAALANTRIAGLNLAGLNLGETFE